MSACGLLRQVWPTQRAGPPSPPLARQPRVARTRARASLARPRPPDSAGGVGLMRRGCPPRRRQADGACRWRVPARPGRSPLEARAIPTAAAARAVDSRGRRARPPASGRAPAGASPSRRRRRPPPVRDEPHARRRAMKGRRGGEWGEEEHRVAAVGEWQPAVGVHRPPRGEECQKLRPASARGRMRQRGQHVVGKDCGPEGGERRGAVGEPRRPRAQMRSAYVRAPAGGRAVVGDDRNGRVGLHAQLDRVVALFEA
mmetsp:Transcript_16938/g.40385  ORF Transcript_16938/g.40385 Transcript_16938/m.40385 type:complete len:257 (+) Transcript_16938:227-997(+)